jgi:hypothetical protein
MVTLTLACRMTRWAALLVRVGVSYDPGLAIVILIAFEATGLSG